MRWFTVLLIVSAVLSFSLQAAPQAEMTKIQRLALEGNIAALKALGPGVLPVLAQFYQAEDESGRTRIAGTFYQLGWKSPEAKQVLMADVHTRNQNLRLQVQWALGRVSADTDVVDVLLENMRNDANPLFRDKAACALAYDQIHLNEKQKVRLFTGLINALSDPKLDVRSIAALALSIHTGQTKGFDANASADRRAAAIQEWKKWLDDYRSRW
jgi:HEAT repeat protein